MTKKQEKKATARLCVFCGQTYALSVHVCSRCRDYKGLIPTRACPSCNRDVDVVLDECPSCGARMEDK